jgi:hypothetical protein
MTEPEPANHVSARESHKEVWGRVAREKFGGALATTVGVQAVMAEAWAKRGENDPSCRRNVVVENMAPGTTLGVELCETEHIRSNTGLPPPLDVHHSGTHLMVMDVTSDIALQVGDLVTHINGKKCNEFHQAAAAIKLDTPVRFKVVRTSGIALTAAEVAAARERLIARFVTAVISRF